MIPTVAPAAYPTPLSGRSLDPVALDQLGLSLRFALPLNNDQPFSVSVERRSGSGFNTIPSGGSVYPIEAIRYSINGAGVGITGRATVRVYSERGNKIFDKQAGLTLSGNAWLDAVAPAIPGLYLVEAEAPLSSLIPFYSPSGQANTTFTVSENAPDAPPGAPGPGGFFGGIGSVFSNLPIILMLAIAIMMLK